MPQCIFTDNETNFQLLYGVPNEHPYVKDSFHDYVIGENLSAVHPGQTGTKSACVYSLDLESGQSVELKMRICSDADLARISVSESEKCGADFEEVFQQRLDEANEFYSDVLSTVEPGEPSANSRQAMSLIHI